MPSFVSHPFFILVSYSVLTREPRFVSSAWLKLSKLSDPLWVLEIRGFRDMTTSCLSSFPQSTPQLSFFLSLSPSLIVFFLLLLVLYDKPLLCLSVSVRRIKLLNIDSACRGHSCPRGRRVSDLRWFWAPVSQRRLTRSGSIVSTLLLNRR